MTKPDLSKDGKPDPTTFDDAVMTAAAYIARIVIERHRKYGPDNIMRKRRNISPQQAILVRAGDKLSRLEYAYDSAGTLPDFDDDTIDDSWTDFGGFGIIGLLLQWGWFTLELDDELPPPKWGPPSVFRATSTLVARRNSAMSKIKLGQKVRDIISGNEGMVVARTEWLHGCVRITVQPEGSKDGCPYDHFTVDEPQLTVVNAKAAPKVAPSHGPREDVGRAPDPALRSTTRGNW